MSRALVEQPLPPDAFSQGDSILVHDPADALSYRQAAQEAVKRGPGRVIQSSQPAAPSAPQLPMSGVANATVGRHLIQLREQAAGLERSIQSPPIGPGGHQVDHLVAGQQQMRTGLGLLREEIARIEAMDDLAVRQLAYKLGAR